MESVVNYIHVKNVDSEANVDVIHSHIENFHGSSEQTKNDFTLEDTDNDTNTDNVTERNGL